MFYRRKKNAILFTMAVLMLTDPVDMLLLCMIFLLITRVMIVMVITVRLCLLSLHTLHRMTLFMSVFLMLMMHLLFPDQQIDHKSGYGTNGCFRSQHTQYKADIHFLRNQDWQHLIRSGQINGYQCSQGDHSACI